ncbi:MAG: two-component system, NarL family, nitrate/nitrite response regulator NarL [Solirubrobacterales bacterium]|jgi:DNA-binding CsgD family transcriptional regulator|nr:two-component system, NarL family, nitrate/nitrite response regulator NarL [Solirubrobacterales bacterium]
MALPVGEHMPRSLGAALESALAARSQAEKLMAIFERSHLPMTMHDGGRQHVEANRPARLMARSSLAELRCLRIDDFMPPDQLPIIDAIWARMLDHGVAIGPGPSLPGPNGVPLEIVVWGMANALPGLHLFACAPADWSEDEIGAPEAVVSGRPVSPLTPRELEVLQLAAEGLSGPSAAERLGLSPATVKTHLSNIYAKLGVSGRAAAVASGMRLGLIE